MAISTCKRISTTPPASCATTPTRRRKTRWRWRGCLQLVKGSKLRVAVLFFICLFFFDLRVEKEQTRDKICAVRISSLYCFRHYRSKNNIRRVENLGSPRLAVGATRCRVCAAEQDDAEC